MNNTGNQGVIAEYDLNPFNLNVLSLERTFFEKVLSINRLSYEGPDRLIEKVRHFYDIYQLYYHPNLKDKVLTNDFFPVLPLALQDDQNNSTMDGEWRNKPLKSSPLFSNLEDMFHDIASGYKTGLTDLVWSDLPSIESILEVFKEIQEFVKRLDAQFSPTNQ